MSINFPIQGREPLSSAYILCFWLLDLSDLLPQSLSLPPTSLSYQDYHPSDDCIRKSQQDIFNTLVRPHYLQPFSSSLWATTSPFYYLLFPPFSSTIRPFIGLFILPHHASLPDANMQIIGNISSPYHFHEAVIIWKAS